MIALQTTRGGATHGACISPLPFRFFFLVFLHVSVPLPAVEASLKFAMLATGRRHFIGVIGAFHGKSLGSLAATSKAAFRKPFSASLLPFTHIPNNDIAAMRRAFESAAFTGNDIAGFIVEPVIGEGGIHICSDEFLREARALCTRYGACLIADEVQSGMGRTGTMWAIEHAGVSPDIMAIAKGFGGGVMGAGAVVGSEAVMSKLFENPFIHTTTFGGNPMALAAATAALYVTETERLPQAASARGDFLISELVRLTSVFPHILKEVRGRGLMIGLEFHNDEVGYAFSSAMFARRCVVAGTLVNSRVIRIEPPLTITEEECRLVIARATHALMALTRAGVGVPERVPASLAAEFNSGGEGALTAPEMDGPAAVAAGLALPLKDDAADAFACAAVELESPKAKASASASAAPAAAGGAGQAQAPVQVQAELTLTAAPQVPAPAPAPAAPAPAAGTASASAAGPAAGDSDDEVGGVHYHPPKSGEKSKAGMRRSKSNGGNSGGLAAAAPAAASAAAAAPASSTPAASAAASASPAGLAASAPVAAASAGPTPSARAPLSHVAAAVTAAATASAAAAAAAAALAPLSLTGCEEAAKPASATAAGAAASLSTVASAAPAAAAAAHEDEEEEDEDECESESDVSSVSSTSTENSGGMDGQSDEDDA